MRRWDTLGISLCSAHTPNARTCEAAAQPSPTDVTASFSQMGAASSSSSAAQQVLQQVFHEQQFAASSYQEQVPTIPGVLTPSNTPKPSPTKSDSDAEEARARRGKGSPRRLVAEQENLTV